ncbi:IS1595 family transposase [Ottowia testudinis]|uniref:IS1595 family transposase n=1 Tax=Ottowia testudinis TaxID=2816950 RepID=A0A975CKP9_9BURK|nr:IS1595 family transposase [Ottowia testudinis]QTD45974.1 IS1595 family transposase [Ottowia testudinis]
MPINPIQFQASLSLPEFMRLYTSQQQCEDALVVTRWPQGWRCPRCEGAHHWCTRDGHGRRLWQCAVCDYQCSVTAGTIFEHTRLPLPKWFLALYLISQSKNGISALALRRQLGVSYKAAWLLKHKVLEVMRMRDESRPLCGRVEIDDAYLGGERTGHAHGGRGALNKTAFVAAVQTDERQRPQRMRLTPVVGFTNEAIEQWAGKALAAGAQVISDGTACFARVSQVGASHERHVTGGGRQAAQLPAFKWVNTMLGNVKMALAATYHGIKHSKYGARYLAEFAYRFNRRHDLAALPMRLLRAAATTKPQPMRIIRTPERVPAIWG